MHLSRRGLLYGTAGVAAVSLPDAARARSPNQLTGFTGIAMPTTTSDRWVVEGADLEERLQGSATRPSSNTARTTSRPRSSRSSR